MSRSSSSRYDLRNLPPGEKRRLAVLLISLVSLGVALAMAPSTVQNWAYAIMGVVITTLGALKTGALAIVCFASRRWLLAFLHSVMCIFLLLLSFPAWLDLISLATGVS